MANKHLAIDRAMRGVLDVCRHVTTPASLFVGVHEALEKYVPVDRWCAMTLDPATSLPTGGVHENGFSAAGGERVLRLEYGGQPDVNALADLARSKAHVNTLAAATRGQVEASARFREVIEPEGLRHELRAVFRDQHGAWAAMVLLRAPDREDFSPPEVELLAAINEPLTRTLRRLLLLAEMQARAEPGAPGLILLEPSTSIEAAGEWEVRHASSTARQWLEQIDDSSTGPLPYALYSLAMCAAREGHAATRIRSRSGHWLTAHAEADLAACSSISIILQPSRPHEIAQILAGAYGLTAREAEVARLVAAGCTNEEIARLLFVSGLVHVAHVTEAAGRRLTLRRRGRNSCAATDPRSAPQAM
ncbi:helix-turn-helix transcriptional regulator [Ramlibacter sp. AW1]|uniref:Helix-turn-helix transcriptional regulator n=1 Tax=Ramlibacter aurantiacus TaxID=2801330 RepID=A0A936ZSE4_9BURK|nr:LuxR C-terminal-related transcriptional regulator [Ramlibacter aurantiacus]MBL0422598.1 helix-turn-helix transcriptional regulator [Ramlibacter aurantiacus]